MRFSESIFSSRFRIARHDLENHLAEALSAGGDYADLYFEYLLTSSIGIDESMVKSVTEGVSVGVGVRVIAGERTGYAYSDDLSPEKIRKAARVAAHIAAGPSHVDKVSLNEGQPHNLYAVLIAPTETARGELADFIKGDHGRARPEQSADGLGLFLLAVLGAAGAALVDLAQIERGKPDRAAGRGGPRDIARG